MRYQTSFRANWIWRDGVAVVSNRPAFATGLPAASKSFELFNGGRKLARLSALKNSALPLCPELVGRLLRMEMFFATERSKFTSPGPCQDVAAGIAQKGRGRWKCEACAVLM